MISTGQDDGQRRFDQALHAGKVKEVERLLNDLGRRGRRAAVQGHRQRAPHLNRLNHRLTLSDGGDPPLTALHSRSASTTTSRLHTFPRQAVGSVVGLGGLAGAVGGTLIAKLTGYLLEATGSYVPVFLIAASAYLVDPCPGAEARAGEAGVGRLSLEPA